MEAIIYIGSFSRTQVQPLITLQSFLCATDYSQSTEGTQYFSLKDPDNKTQDGMILITNGGSRLTSKSAEGAVFLNITNGILFWLQIMYVP